MAQPFHILKPREFPHLLSVVVPCYNEEEVLPLFRAEMTSFLQRVPCAIELVMVNDGSADRSLELLAEWSAQEPRVKVVGLARNFGHQAAVTAGLDTASGDAVVIMDADLQDPPEVVLQMLDRYRQGYEVVYGRRRSRREESWMKRLSAWAFYRLMRRFVHKDLPADAGDFRLISRRVMDSLHSMREMHRFLRGMVAWVGFAQIDVPFDRPPRAAGQTKYPLSKMLRFAWTAAVSFGTAPLRLSLGLGIVVAFMGAGIGLWAVITHFIGYTERGWTSLMAVFCLVGGSILASIGILGEYIGRIFEEVKGRPLYVIATRLNLTDPSEKKVD